jgi:hypothetical protein
MAKRICKIEALGGKTKIALSKDQNFDLPEEFVCISDNGTPVTNSTV